MTQRFIALLRGINVTGRNTIPMAELRAECERLGWSGVVTYINSGNVIFGARGKPAALEAALEAAIQRRFGFAIPVLVRAAADWPALVKANPFASACATDPSRVMLCLAKGPLGAQVAEELTARAAAGERVQQAGEALWIHFPEGVARSKLSPAAMDRAAGSPVTARNWRTATKLLELCGA